MQFFFLAMWHEQDLSVPDIIISEVAQSCPTLCDPVDCSPPGSSVHGILQARILEWGARPSSRGSEPRSPALQADSLPAEPQVKPG